MQCPNISQNLSPALCPVQALQCAAMFCRCLVKLSAPLFPECSCPPAPGSLSPAVAGDCDLTDAQAPVLGQQVSIDQVDACSGILLQDTLDDHGAQQTGVEVVAARAAVADVDVREALVGHQAHGSLAAGTGRGRDRGMAEKQHRVREGVDAWRSGGGLPCFGLVMYVDSLKQNLLASAGQPAMYS